MNRQYPSGAQKRKLLEENKQKQKQAINKVPKLTSFFKVTEPKSSVPTSEENNQAHSITDTDTSLHKSLLCQENESEDAKAPDLKAPISKVILESVNVNNRAKDPGLWTEFCAEDVTFWIDQGPESCQHHQGPFDASLRTYDKGPSRFCSKSVFFGTKANGEQYSREWLLYSPTTGSIYCFVCKLFPKSSSVSSRLAGEGFSDWKNAGMQVQQHESSKHHRESMLAYISRRNGAGLTHKLEEQIKSEREYWQNVLKRVVAVIKTLAERGLPFRGTNETFGSSKNGNFLGILELLAEFDPFLAAHISKYGNCGKGQPSYLSKTICDELIDLMGNKVRLVILSEIASAGYFSLSIDSTPDLSHLDQLSIIIRYVSPTDGKPVERFLNYLQLKNHTGEEMAKQVLNYLQENCRLDFSKCRGQSYDNAANMAGRYNGMQQKIIEQNSLAIFIPCAAHSLNIVGRSAVNCCLTAVNFFSTVQLLYTFFSASTHRWGVLKKHLENELVLKALSETRWEAHSVATKAIMESYSSIIDALYEVYEDESQKGEARREADSIANKMQEFEFVFQLVLWNEILQVFHRSSKALQGEKVNLKTCADLYQSLENHLHSLRNGFEKLESKAKEILPKVEFKETVTRKRIRKKQDNDGSEPEVPLNPRDKFRVSTFNVIIDTLEANIRKRSEVYKTVAKKFSFLTELTLSEEECVQRSKVLVESYQSDLNHSLSGELHQFHCYARTKFPDKEYMSHLELYSCIFMDGIQCVFPNVEIALRIFLTLMITNCSAERSFSQLKRLKNPQRTTISQEKLNSLALLFIEADILRDINFDEVITDFAIQKSRKKFI